MSGSVSCQPSGVRTVFDSHRDLGVHVAGDKAVMLELAESGAEHLLRDARDVVHETGVTPHTTGEQNDDRDAPLRVQERQSGAGALDHLEILEPTVAAVGTPRTRWRLPTCLVDRHPSSSLAG
jgi:hypothetical protein